MKRSVILGFVLTGVFGCGAARADVQVIAVYPGYGTAAGAVVEGRVFEQEKSAAPAQTDGRLQNLKRNVRLFKNDEREQQAVDIRIGPRQWQVKTDDEGYFRVTLDAGSAHAPGWHAVDARSGKAREVGALLIVPPENRRGLISDLDDTILVTEVTSRRRMLGNTFLKNPGQREAVPGMAALYRAAMAINPQPDAAPLFYLSASPRQLHGAISEFLSRNTFPRGVLITKRVTNDRTSEPLLDQFAYKTQKIEEIFARVPGVRFVLVGDDGERDPEIYDWVRRRYPDRVEAIWIRHVHPDGARARLPEQRDIVDVLRTLHALETR